MKRGRDWKQYPPALFVSVREPFRPNRRHKRWDIDASEHTAAFQALVSWTSPGVSFASGPLRAEERWTAEVIENGYGDTST